LDQRKVSERLGEVAQVLAALAQLPRVEPEMVGVGQHLLEHRAGELDLAGEARLSRGAAGKTEIGRQGDGR
jgi:hypothetical protein